MLCSKRLTVFHSLKSDISTVKILKKVSRSYVNISNFSVQQSIRQLLFMAAARSELSKGIVKCKNVFVKTSGDFAMFTRAFLFKIFLQIAAFRKFPTS